MKQEESSSATNDFNKDSNKKDFPMKGNKIRWSNSPTTLDTWCFRAGYHGEIPPENRNSKFKFFTIWNNIQMQSYYQYNILWIDRKEAGNSSSSVLPRHSQYWCQVLLMKDSLQWQWLWQPFITAPLNLLDSSWGQGANRSKNLLLLNFFFFYIWDQHGGFFFLLYLHLPYSLSYHMWGHPHFLINL